MNACFLYFNPICVFQWCIIPFFFFFLSDTVVQFSRSQPHLLFHCVQSSRLFCCSLQMMWWGEFEVAKAPVHFHWLWRRGGSLLPPDWDWISPVQLEPETDATSAETDAHHDTRLENKTPADVYIAMNASWPHSQRWRGYNNNDVYFATVVVLHLHRSHIICNAAKRISLTVAVDGCTNGYDIVNVRDIFWGLRGDSAHCSKATFSNARDWTVVVMDIECLSAKRSHLGFH